ncbi:MAG: hypothetical protein B7Z61_02170 [Acidobacteria bacterium 37-71-11]|nr:MAG: hypothetical protein B7Z61_02170 [Acidobacteria bacterium 37-71-11]HQT95898.1 serine/threonine-protein kinase [Thermoanaerobaculaceae bacterium]
MGEAGNEGKQTDTRTPVVGGPAGWGFELPPRWRLERLLGQGGQAEVWLAMDEQLGELVAVKIFHPAVSLAALGRLRREVRLGRSLQHPDLVRIYELIEAGGRLALAMEWLPQGSLAAKLERDGALATDAVVAVAQQVLVALEHLQAHGVVHRDIKPSNLLLDAQGRVKVGDLGLVKVQQDGEHLTQTAMAVGSPGYMSPEQIRGQELTPASDLYSLGVTLFQLLTGQMPFHGTSNFEVAHAHIERPAPDPRRLRFDCPRWLAWFVRRLLEKQPRDRWPDAATARRVLDQRRAVASPRFWRRLAAVSLLTVAAVAAAFVVGRRLLGGQASPLAADVVADGNRLRGLDAQGRTLWSFTCDAPVQEVDRASLFGDGTTQVVACAYRKTGTYVRVEHEPPSEVVVLGLDGRLVSEFRPDAAATAIDRTPIAPPLLVPTAHAVDLLGDGRREILLNCRHRILGTAYLFVFWPRIGRWEMVLAHPGGWLFQVEPVPNSRIPRVHFLAFNGLLASSPVIAELAFAPPGSRARLAFPDANDQGIAGAITPGGSTLSWYTLLEQEAPGSFDTGPGFVLEPDGSSTFSVHGTRYTVDRWGNPSTGPNLGRDLRALRIAVTARTVDLLAVANSGDRTLLPDRERSLTEDAAPLLAERPYRALLALYSGRAHAEIGDLPGGMERLRAGWEATGNDSLGLALGHLQAIAGDLTGAEATLRRNRARGVTPAGHFRTTQLLTRVAIELHDRDTLRDAIADWPAVEPAGAQAELRARADLWWNDLHDEDCEARSFDTAPDGEAIACLARWRLGKTRPTDPDAMADAAKRNPDATMECNLARAMALLALGRTSEAVQATLSVVTYLKPRCAYDFMLYQLLGLARACNAKALLAAGRRDEAAQEAARLLASLRPGLLPAILAGEVVRDAPPQNREGGATLR